MRFVVAPSRIGAPEAAPVGKAQRQQRPRLRHAKELPQQRPRIGNEFDDARANDGAIMCVRQAFAVIDQRVKRQPFVSHWQLSRLLQHRGRGIIALDAKAMRGEGRRDAARSAAVIQHGLARRNTRGDGVDEQPTALIGAPRDRAIDLTREITASLVEDVDIHATSPRAQITLLSAKGNARAERAWTPTYAANINARHGVGSRLRVGHFGGKDFLHPAGWEVAGLGLLVLFYAVVYVTVGEPAYDFANFAGEVGFSALLIAGAVRAVGIDPIALWLGVFWLRVASAVYFGTGSILKIFFNEYTTLFVDSYYYVSPAALFQVNWICALSIFIFLVSLFAMKWIFPFTSPSEEKNSSDPLLFVMGVLFATAGYAVKYLFVLPNMFGLYGDPTPSGIASAMTYLAVAGLFLITLWSTQFALRFIFIPTLLLCADIVTGALLLSKGAVVFPLIVYILGICRYRANFARLSAAAVTVILIFNTLVPAVQFGRAELGRRYGYIDAGDLSERSAILLRYFTEETPVGSPVSQLSPLARFYYANAMAAAAAQHDAGRPGTTLGDIWTILVPRAIWPEKPIFNVGSQFNLSVVGDPNSSTWMGVYAEAYWNLGWFGLPIVMIPLAIGYAIMGRWTILILKQSKWLHFPVALFNVWAGMRVDADIVLTQFVIFVGCCIIYLVANILETPLLRLLGIGSGVHGAVNASEAVIAPTS